MYVVTVEEYCHEEEEWVLKTVLGPYQEKIEALDKATELNNISDDILARGIPLQKNYENSS